MSVTLPSLEDIRTARTRIAGVALRTPLVRLELPDTDAEIYVKLECLQPIGSFKLRGALNAMRRLDPAMLAEGVVTASAGNMAQGVAYCARLLGVPCSVVVPDSAPRTKIAAIGRMGGRVVKAEFDRWWETFETRRYPGLSGTFIHPFDDEAVMAGSGTIGLEILEEVPDVDTVIVPWGGGGLCCGIASAIRALRPATRVMAAEVDTAAPLTPSFRAGQPVVVERTPSFVDGIGGQMVFPRMWERAQELVAAAHTASLDEIRQAIRLLVERARVVAEGAGACALAVARSGRAGGGKIACIVSGGNIDPHVLAEILANA